MKERIIPGDIVEFTLGLHQQNERRERGPIVTLNPQVVWVKLPDNNIIKRHRVKHSVVLVKDPQKIEEPQEVAQTPEAPEPEAEKGGKRSLDDMFSELIGEGQQSS